MDWKAGRMTLILKKSIDNFPQGDNNAYKKSKESWARLIAKIYEIDLLYMDVPMPAVTGGEGAGL